tara:strand:- start:319 stop:495 length:177 start_codon:yes stop_codon:yes gene_type:complete
LALVLEVLALAPEVLALALLAALRAVVAARIRWEMLSLQDVCRTMMIVCAAFARKTLS